MPTATRGRGRATGLTPDKIVEAAYRLISAHGLAWFSMRKLAAELDVNPMTIYLRFDNKDELLDAVARRGLVQLRLPESADAPWVDRVVALCDALRDHLVADRNLLALYATTERMSTPVQQWVEEGMVLMEEVGYRDRDAVRAFRAVFWHTVGFALVHHRLDGYPADTPGGLVEATGPVDSSSHPTFARNLAAFTPVDGDALFVHTTRLLANGLAADAPVRPQPRPSTEDRQ